MRDPNCRYRRLKGADCGAVSTPTRFLRRLGWADRSPGRVVRRLTPSQLSKRSMRVSSTSTNQTVNDDVVNPFGGMGAWATVARSADLRLESVHRMAVGHDQEHPPTPSDKSINTSRPAPRRAWAGGCFQRRRRLAPELPRSASDPRPASPWRGARAPGSERSCCRW
jgi:hypothetical protein